MGSFANRDLALTIGLPLVAGLNVQQLTGVLAHEFGHFSQGYGMRVSYLIRVINHWFLRAAYDRDRWDDYLAGASNGIDIRIGAFFYVARFFVWLARNVIAFVGIIGHGLSCFMLRQMEYDADRYETRMVGARTFSATCRDLTSISLAHQMASNDTSEFYREGRLPDNIPKLAVSNIPHITPEIRKHVRAYEIDRQTGWFDSHPTNRDRINSAKKENTKGEFHPPMKFGELPASVLFHDFERVCKATTVKFYAAILGANFKKRELRETRLLIEKRDAEYLAGQALDRYFQVHIPTLRPLKLHEDICEKPSEPHEVLARVKASREKMLKMCDEYEVLSKCLDGAEETWIMAAQAESLSECKVRFKPKDYRLETRKRKQIRERLKESKQCVTNIEAKMFLYEEVAEERLSCALKLLQISSVRQQIESGDDFRLEIDRYIAVTRIVMKLMYRIPDLRLSFVKLSALCGHLDKRHRPLLYEAIETQMREIHRVLKRLQKSIAGEMYPFDNAEVTLTLADYVIPTVPEETDVMGLVYVTQEAWERLAGVQTRLFAKFAHIAEQIEDAVGLPPLKSRKTDDDVSVFDAL